MLVAVAAYVVLIAIGELLDAALDEIPHGFGASVIWHFRVATLGVHVVL